MDSTSLTIENIAAIVLAAGQSKRMGCPKLVLPWGNNTVIGHVVDIIRKSGIVKIVVITGGARDEVENALDGLPVQCIFNPEYSQGMVSSLRVGLQSLDETIRAALVTLGDQPQIETGTVRGLISAYLLHRSRLVVPSYRNRRGHPWLIERSLWEAVIRLQPHQTLRDFLRIHEGKINYLLVDTGTVLQDLDTPEDYQRFFPKQ